MSSGRVSTITQRGGHKKLGAMIQDNQNRNSGQGYDHGTMWRPIGSEW